MFSSSPVIGQRFAFAYGRIGVLQQSLLSQSDIDRMLGAHDRKETEQVLTELRFTKLIDQSLRDADAVLTACEEWVRREVAAMCPPDKQAAFDILWLDGDLPVLAYLLKKQKGMTSTVSNEPMPPYSVYGAEALRLLVDNNIAGDLPATLVSFVSAIRNEDINDPRIIDARVSQFGADLRMSFAKKSGSAMVRRYVSHLVDVQNIRTVLRLANTEKDAVLPHLLTGGTITPAALVAKDSSVVTQARIAGLYAFADTLDKYPSDINRIERALSDILAEDISDMWNLILSIEPLFAFASTALAQIRLLRAINIGKRNALGPQEIKNMLPPFLSATHYLS